MSGRPALLLLLIAGGCTQDQFELALDIRESSDHRVFVPDGGVLHLRAERDDRVLVDETYPLSTSVVSVRGVPYGPRTVFTLEDSTANGDVVARGSTCPIDFFAPGMGGAARASLYFAATHYFAATVGAPITARSDAIAFPLPTGAILLSGGRSDSGVVASSETFSVASAQFSPSDSALSVGRAGAQVVEIAGIGALVIGGESAAGQALSTSEIFRYDTGLFTSFDNATLGPRSGHRVLTLGDGGVLVTGGAATPGGAPLNSTVTIQLQSDGTATFTAGATMRYQRREHAVVLASGVPVLIGGFGIDGAPLATMEALVPPSAIGDRPAFRDMPSLRTPRAQATASVLQDGTILVVGGVGDAAGTPLRDAELYNPITGLTTVFTLQEERRSHSATILPDGRLLVLGGIGIDGAPLSSADLFLPGVGFVAEHPLVSARAGHRAVPLCDGTVLVVGGGVGAELYMPPP